MTCKVIKAESEMGRSNCSSAPDSSSSTYGRTAIVERTEAIQRIKNTRQLIIAFILLLILLNASHDYCRRRCRCTDLDSNGTRVYQGKFALVIHKILPFYGP